LSKVIQIDEGKIRAHLREVVRSPVDNPTRPMPQQTREKFCTLLRGIFLD